MTERPILFSAPMVRAILEGRKTQTRRIVKGIPDGWTFLTQADGIAGFHHPGYAGEGQVKCPHGSPGERLWVRETWGEYIQDIGDVRQDRWCVYKADEKSEPSDNGGKAPWRPSIHMPREFSRILLEITDIRVERLQDISEEDAKAEGMIFTDYGLQCFHPLADGRPPKKHDPSVCPATIGHPPYPGWSWKPTKSHEECLISAKWAFANLWTEIKGPDSWNANPWVWAISFRRIDQNAKAAA